MWHYVVEPPKRESGSGDSGKDVIGGEATNTRVAELQQELERMRLNTVGKEDYDNLQAEVNTLTENLIQLKTSFNKKILDLMTEVDEEKKTRLSMQVEIERIKKLVTS